MANNGRPLLRSAAMALGWRALGSPVNAAASRPARRHVGHAIAILAIMASSAGLFWLVWLYASGLRDPRYLDGWVLAGGMGLQLCYHIAIKTAQLSPKWNFRWRKLHVFLGYVLIAAFISHSDFTLPDTGFEWALWAGFVLVVSSGIFGAYITWAMAARLGLDETVTYERIASLRTDLARDLLAVIEKSDSGSSANGLPAPPYGAWIADLYANHLKDFFDGKRNFAAHLVGSQRALKSLTDEIDSLSRYVDLQSQDRLAAIKGLVIEKDRLDFACAYLGLTHGWKLVHVPVTYSLVVLTLLHIVVVYSYSSGLL